MLKTRKKNLCNMHNKYVAAYNEKAKKRQKKTQEALPPAFYRAR